MTNREKYKDEILDLLRKSDSVDVADFYETHVVAKYNTPAYIDTPLVGCILGMALWLGEEYEEPKVDWSKVEIDTPVLVKQSRDNDWAKRYFAKYENGKIFTWGYGTTSWSCDREGITEWNYAKLATEE